MTNKIIKKSLIIFFLSAISLTVISTSANANMFNRFKKGFYFEKYKTADEAKAALLEMHPVGSDVNDLVKTLERAGAESSIHRKEIQLYEYTSDISQEKGTGKKVVWTRIEKISDPKQDYLNFKYKLNGLQTMFICAEEWYLNVQVDAKDLSKVSTIEIYRDFFCL